MGQGASLAPQNMHWASTIKVVLAWVLASVPRRTDVGVRFLPRPAVKDAFFGQTKIIFFGLGTAAQPAAMGTLDGFWFFLFSGRRNAQFSLAYWPGLDSASGFASGLH